MTNTFGAAVGDLGVFGVAIARFAVVSISCFVLFSEFCRGRVFVLRFVAFERFVAPAMALCCVERQMSPAVFRTSLLKQQI